MKKYRHFKGNIYEYIGTAIHSETEEKLVIYKNDKGVLFARPYDIFFELVERDGNKIPRFEELEDNETTK